MDTFEHGARSIPDHGGGVVTYRTECDARYPDWHPKLLRAPGIIVEVNILRPVTYIPLPVELWYEILEVVGEFSATPVTMETVLMHYKDLPFDTLRSRTIASCCRVCKAFQAIIQPFLYESIRMRSGEDVTHIMRVLRRSPQLLSKVQTLVVDGGGAQAQSWISSALLQLSNCNFSDLVQVELHGVDLRTLNSTTIRICTARFLSGRMHLANVTYTRFAQLAPFIFTSETVLLDDEHLVSGEIEDILAAKPSHTFGRLTLPSHPRLQQLNIISTWKRVSVLLRTLEPTLSQITSFQLLELRGPPFESPGADLVNTQGALLTAVRLSELLPSCTRVKVALSSECSIAFQRRTSGMTLCILALTLTDSLDTTLANLVTVLKSTPLFPTTVFLLRLIAPGDTRSRSRPPVTFTLSPSQWASLDVLLCQPWRLQTTLRHYQLELVVGPKLKLVPEHTCLKQVMKTVLPGLTANLEPAKEKCARCIRRDWQRKDEKPH
ncbi:hypothetical protein EIP91_005792 [Steccherinum ochraceum]|uniref:F-box domain-containing protein n=1 Tax=Steccherinum ochraceum TaxID=92696 RepID=A0A4R0R6R0_9APHY|nr:hypothetical protein EIP91_005792 [Steccherinum ochraceum]